MKLDQFLDLARHDARQKQAHEARVACHRTRDITRAAHHRLRKAYYERIKQLGVASEPAPGIEAKVEALLGKHSAPELSRGLAVLRDLQAQAQRAERARREADEAAALADEILRRRSG